MFNPALTHEELYKTAVLIYTEISSFLVMNNEREEQKNKIK